MSKIIIKRSSEWNNKARKIGIYINEEKISTINDGETQEYEIENGKHEIYAKIDWCRSQKIELNTINNETKVLKLTGFKYGVWILPTFVGIMFIYFVGKYTLNVELNFLLVLSTICFLYPIYFITLGKNRYLVLTENKE